VNTIMIERRGYESALSACPAPVAAFAAAAVPAPSRRRAVAPGSPHFLGAITPFQGTGLPVAVQQVNDSPITLDQPHPGDKARRPPA
jgi:hypothetical protein